VQLTALEDAWLTAVADVRGVSRPAAVREAISWLAARETARVSRTRHYRVIGYIARQEIWNPVDELLDAAAREADGHPTPQRAVPGVLRASLRPLPPSEL
jgi:hypothetical protein